MDVYLKKETPRRKRMDVYPRTHPIFGAWMPVTQGILGHKKLVNTHLMLKNTSL
ncbi:hypothetical protein [uncultured Sunxiuqinia sp.]|uniref:hypothetical protein n=1 Tax=uncultured Sunxiuqinia sp. TaxID=1573825 RepID=UPI002605DBF2|nr:hypothetical protein [uncultured Sunxiuqinia sp.]